MTPVDALARPLAAAVQVPRLVGLHFGHLSPAEQVAVYLLGLGPFLLLAAVVVVVRRHDAAQAGQAGETAQAHRTADADRSTGRVPADGSAARADADGAEG